MELTYGLGLRASDPATRDKFYRLWNNAIPPSLFERLKHVIMGQNWEEMGSTFWLKQAVVSLDPLLAGASWSCSPFFVLSLCSLWLLVGTEIVVARDPNRCSVAATQLQLASTHNRLKLAVFASRKEMATGVVR